MLQSSLEDTFLIPDVEHRAQCIYWSDSNKTQVFMQVIIISNPNICRDLLQNCSKLIEISSQQQGFYLKNRHKLVKFNSKMVTRG